jgi:phosphohistidine phosphatase SixA
VEGAVEPLPKALAGPTPETTVETAVEPAPEPSAEPESPKRPASMLQRALKEALRTYEKLAEQALETLDEETVHEFRVATRRLDVAIDLARRVLPAHDAARARRRLKARFEVTGALRDVQTWRLLLAIWREVFPDAVALMDGHLAAREEAQRALVRKTLKKKPAGAVVEGLKPMLEAARRERDEERLRRAVDKRLDRAFGRLEEARRSVDPARAETLHAFRLRLKNARYAVEVAVPFHARTAPAALETFKAHQTAIGNWHDLDNLAHAFELFVLESPALAEPCAPLVEALRQRLAEDTRTLVERLPVPGDLDPRPAVEPEKGPWTLILARHAKAVDAEKWGERPDEERPLTGSGEKQARRAAKILKSWGLRVERVLTSPAVRARCTAEIFAAALGAGKRLETLDALSAGADPRGVIPALTAPAAGSALLLVGHEPALSELASMLVSGRRSLPLDVPTAGLVAITLEQPAWKACGRLVRLVPADAAAAPKGRKRRPRAAEAT